MSTPDIDRSAWPPVPGPADRRSFFDEQRRNRRATWRLSALCFAVVLVISIPLSVVITPIVYAAALLTVDVVNLAVPVPNPVRRFTHESHPLGEIPPPPPTQRDIMIENGLVILIAVGPGAVTLLGLWLAVWRLFLRGGVGGILLAMGARPPQSGDLEEQQLRNVVEEMAIAAGVQPPRLLLIDIEIRNGAVVGSSSADATLVISRRMLDELNRDETQGIIAHLVASIGNGDLRAGLRMLSVFRTIGLLLVLLQAPFGRQSWRLLGRLLRLLIWPGRLGEDSRAAAESREVGDLLAGTADASLSADMDAYTSRSKTDWRDIPRLPFLVAYLAVWLTQALALNFGLVPLMALAWRARRHLADSMAVQLTRHPDGLAQALLRLGQAGTAGGAWTAFLFAAGLGKEKGPMLGFLPEPARRLRRLVLQGAHLEAIPPTSLEAWWENLRRGATPVQLLGRIGLLALFGLLFLVMGGLMVTVIVLITGVSLACNMLFLGTMVMILHALLRSVGQA